MPVTKRQNLETLQKILDAMTESKDSQMRKKISLNFPDRQETMHGIARITTVERRLIQSLLGDKTKINQQEINGLKIFFKSTFKKVKGTDNDHEKIESFEIICKMVRSFVPAGSSHEMNAIAIVLSFLECGVFGDRGETNEQ